MLVRARRKCLAALGPSVHHHVGLARRYELYALSSTDESGGNSPRLLVTGWLCYRRYYRGTPTLSTWSPSPPPMPPTPPPPGAVFKLPPAIACCRLMPLGVESAVRYRGDDLISNRSNHYTRTIMRPRRLRHPRHPRRRRRRLRHPYHFISSGTVRAFCAPSLPISPPLTALRVFASCRGCSVADAPPGYRLAAATLTSPQCWSC